MTRAGSGPETLGASPVANFRKVVSRIEQVPTLPDVITRVLELAQDPDVSTHQVAEIVGHDQSMVSSILRMVNSPFYALSNRITSIQHAVVLLGMRTVRNVALSSVLVKTFGDSSEDRRFDRGLLWRHTVACAIGARLLAQTSRLVDPEEAFLSGLIHDIGLVVLDQFFHDDFCRVLDLVTHEGVTLCQAENEIFGHDHAAAGALLARQWNFPAPVVEAIACHHHPSRARRDKALAALVHLADFLGRRPDLTTPPGMGEFSEEEEAVGLAMGPAEVPGMEYDLEEEEAGGAPGDGGARRAARRGELHESADETGPVEAAEARAGEEAAKPAHPRQIWETELLDPSALETARLSRQGLSEFRAAFWSEWNKAQVFVSLRG